jgi:hypothetical protein
MSLVILFPIYLFNYLSNVIRVMVIDFQGPYYRFLASSGSLIWGDFADQSGISILY